MTWIPSVPVADGGDNLFTKSFMENSIPNLNIKVKFKYKQFKKFSKN